MKIERNSPLYSKPVSGVPCTFRTCYETTLWPLTVSAAEWRAPSRLQPAVKTNDSAWAIRAGASLCARVSFQALSRTSSLLPRWRERAGQHTLRTSFQPLNRIVIRDLSKGSRLAGDAARSALSAAALPGSGDDPLCPSSFAGHRLLMEYFAFPEKFFFVDLSGLECSPRRFQECDRSHLPHLPVKAMAASSASSSSSRKRPSAWDALLW